MFNINDLSVQSQTLQVVAPRALVASSRRHLMPMKKLRYLRSPIDTVTLGGLTKEQVSGIINANNISKKSKEKPHTEVSSSVLPATIDRDNETLSLSHLIKYNKSLSEEDFSKMIAELSAEELKLLEQERIEPESKDAYKAAVSHASDLGLNVLDYSGITDKDTRPTLRYSPRYISRVLEK